MGDQSGTNPDVPSEMGGSAGDGERVIDRRRLLMGAGVAGFGLLAGPLVGRASASTRLLGSGGLSQSGPMLVRQPGVAGAPPAEQLHLQFGADAATAMVASWVAADRVARPRLRLGTPGGGLGSELPADERVYAEAISGETVHTYHAAMDRLDPDTDYIYEVLADGAKPVRGRFHTGPAGRAAFRFSSFGDQSIPAKVGPGKLTGPWTPNAGYVVDAVEATNPLFHLLNGDLCYANVSDDPVATWRSFFNNNMRSARRRPWMPAAGNHENEVGNGPLGFDSYQTRFELPDSGSEWALRHLWYWFRVGQVAVVSINNDDVCIQAGSFSKYRLDNLADTNHFRHDYVQGYSAGAQKAWLERTLAEIRADKSIDWLVVCMHQVAMSSAHFNGADLGIRQEWLPLFDRYGVDLVVAGHEHHFERTHPVKGADMGPAAPDGRQLLTPLPHTSAQGSPSGDEGAVIDTTKGAVHLIIGGGGHSTPTPPSAFDMPHDGVVIYGVDTMSDGSHPAKTTTEPGDWSAFRDLKNPYGFAIFDVDPGEQGSNTTIEVTYFGTTAGSADYSQVVDKFTLTRPRRD